jgi:hypothetical protein
MIMTRYMLKAGIVTLMLASLASAGDRGELVGVGQLPEVVLSSATNAASDVKWLVSFRFHGSGPYTNAIESDKGADDTWYRVAGRDLKQNRLVKVMVQANGRIIDVRTEMPADEVPRAAILAVASRFPNFTPKSVEAVGLTSKSTTYYILGGELDGAVRSIGVSPDGGWMKKF